MRCVAAASLSLVAEKANWWLTDKMLAAHKRRSIGGNLASKS
ncbi:MAG: hypothetical protein CM15mP68_5690 [Pseudomonadota bacterium]|nr:MAG: hypothetical protein CM15mP68_5690 [Pseudomonadota bacterium]